MSHTARNNALTDELVQLITGYSPSKNARAYQVCKDAAARSLRRHPYGRTNQFEVQNSLEGLVEKFEILNKDDVAEALSSKLKILHPKSDKWTPEILSLLLHLSDNPGAKTKIESLESHDIPEPLPTLTWEEIQADDPLQDKEIWRDIDYAGESSDEDTTFHSRTFSEETHSTGISDHVEDEHQPSAESFIIRPDPTVLEKIRVAQQWRELNQRSQNVEISELQFIRETILALRGLPTPVFKEDPKTGRYEYQQRYRLLQTSQTALLDVGESFAEVVSQIQGLREFCNRRRSSPTLRAFSYSLSKTLHVFDQYLDAIGERLSVIQGPVVVSLLDLQSDVEIAANFLLRIREVVEEVPALNEDESYLIVDMLYERICESQMMEDGAMYKAFADTFLDVLRTYLKPIDKWMSEGVIDTNDKDFLIEVDDDDQAPEIFWQSRYRIRKHHEKPATPHFFHSLTSEILSAGKSVAFIKRLGLPLEDASFHSTHSASTFEFEVHYGTTNLSLSLLPFSTHFTEAFTSHIHSKHQSTATYLKHHLLTTYNLARTATALQTIYLSQTGSLFASFAASLFAKLDATDPTWSNPLIIQDLASSSFGQHPSIDPAAITASLNQNTTTTANQHNPRSVAALAAISLTYSYPWPVANIIPSTALQTYQAAFTLLLQLRRASSLLSALRLRSSSSSSPTSTPAHNTTRQTNLTHHLRHRLLFLTTTLQDHLLNTCVAHLSAQLSAAVESASDVDELIAAYAAFEAGLKGRLLLGREMQSVRGAVVSVLDLCVLFCGVVGGWGRGTAKRGGGGEMEHEDGEKGKEEEEDEQDEGVDADGQNNESKTAEGAVEPLVDATPRLQQMRMQLTRLVALITSGLRSASRGGDGGGSGESWAVLAERLEMAVPSSSRRVE